MDCERANELFAEHLLGMLEESKGAELRVHLADCGECRREADRLSATWRMLGLLPSEKPSPMLRARFYQTMEAYNEGREQAPAARSADTAWWTRLWPARPGLQMGLAAACALMGVFAGRTLLPAGPAQRPAESAEMTRLQQEVRNMHEMVALSLLQNQSAADRLRGVSYSYRVGGQDAEVVSALLQAVNHDQNVNVRLAAVDALKNFGQSAVVRKGLTQSLPKQDSPMVQVALIDALVDLRDAQAMGLFRDLAQKDDANQAVRQRAEWGMKQLGSETQ
jgi:hypothetical protein